MKLSLVNKKELALGVWEMSFSIDGKGFSFTAGQYIRLVLPRLEYEDTKGPGRTFSIASSPTDKKKIDIIFRLSESGFKKTLIKMPVGQELEVEGPWGTLLLPESAVEPVMLLAGGIGITPFISMIRFAAEQKSPQKILLLWALRNEQNAIYVKELEELQEKNKNFNFAIKYGPFDQEFIRSKITVTSGSHFYISGPSGMIDASLQILDEMGVPISQIAFEEWSEWYFRQMPQAIFLTSPDGISITDLNGVIRFVNPAWEQLTGWKSGEVVNKFTHRILKSGDKSPEFYKNIWDNSLKGLTVREEFHDKRKDGSLYYADEVFIPFLSHARVIFGHVGLQRDITDRKRMEQDLLELSQNLEKKVKEKTKELEADKDKLRETNAKTEVLLESIGHGVIATDKEGNITLMNMAAGESLGWQFEEIKGKQFAEVITVEDERGRKLPFEERPIGKALLMGRKVVTSLSPAYYYLRKDGSKFAVAIITNLIVSDGEITGFVESFRDISREKEVDKAKSEFVSIASHQLRGPLTTTKWYVDIIEEEFKTLKPEYKKYFDEIYNANEKMIELVGALLQVSKIEMGTLVVNFEPTDVIKISKTLLSMLEPQIRTKKLTVRENYDELPLLIQSDPEILQMILQNLLTNAIKYTPEGGRLDLYFEKQNNNFFIKVTDTGYGILKNERSKVFTKFFRSEKASKIDPHGTGLGLYITKSIVEKLGGKIWFESEENKGSTFFVSLPLQYGLST